VADEVWRKMSFTRVLRDEKRENVRGGGGSATVEGVGVWLRNEGMVKIIFPYRKMSKRSFWASRTGTPVNRLPHWRQEFCGGG